MLEYTLTFAYVPFITDTAARVPLRVRASEHGPEGSVLPRFQPELDLLDEVNRIIPLSHLKDFSPQGPYPGRNLGALPRGSSSSPTPSTRVGDWYYPRGASRWSVFRGLATSSMMKAMVSATQNCSLPAQFVMEQNPVAPNHDDNDVARYTLRSQMYLLPPRPLGEQGGTFDGLYLITLVDERYYFRGSPVSLRPAAGSTWASLISQLSSVLDISLTPPIIPAVYGNPEPDSQLWCNFEDAAFLLDALAYNVGCVVVRALDGTYSFLTPAQSQAVVSSNRGDTSKVVRVAGGDLFYSGTSLPGGDLSQSKNSVIPQSVTITFPKYVQGDDPVPHFLNPRYQNPRPPAWYEESYGDVYSVTVPVSSGGPNVSGLTGVSTQALHSTARALYSGESQAASGSVPINSSGLSSLALQMARDLYDSRAAAALDEVYPGTFTWAPEGIHDIIWTYSTRSRLACTRVMKAEWDDYPTEFQHGAVALSGSSSVPRGVGGPSVAQTWRDTESGPTSTQLAGSFNSGDPSASLLSATSFPQAYRWRGVLGGETVLFEGCSGGSAPGVVLRGIDGTLISNYLSGDTVTQTLPQAGYGVNLVTVQDPLRVAQGAWTSGGVCEIILYSVASGVSVTLTSGSSTVSGTTTQVASGPWYTVSGFPTPLPSGNCVMVSGAQTPVPVVSNNVLIMVPGFPVPVPVVSNNVLTMVPGFPVPVVSNNLVVVSEFPSPVPVVSNNVLTMVPGFPEPVVSNGILVIVPGFPTPVPVVSNNVLIMVPGFPEPVTSNGTLVLVPGFPTPTPVVSNNVLTMVPGFPMPVTSNGTLTIVPGFPTPVPVVSNNVLTMVPGFPTPVTSNGTWQMVAGWPVPLPSGPWQFVGGVPVPSGGYTSGILASGSVVSGDIASGSISSGMLASGLLAFITGGTPITSGSVVQSFPGSVPGGLGAFANIGINLTLPGSGKYLLFGVLAGRITNPVSGEELLAKLVDTSGGSAQIDVPNTTVVLVQTSPSVTGNVDRSQSVMTVYITSGSTNIDVAAKETGAASGVVGVVAASTALGYARLL